MKNKIYNHKKLSFRYFNEGTDNYEIEMLWCIKDNDKYIVNNIPIYVPSVAFKDVVEGKLVNGELFATKIFKASGNSTIRMLFKDKSLIKNTIDKMGALGCAAEVSNIPHLVAFNIPKEVDYFNIIWPYLQEGERGNKWEYEEGCLGHEKMKRLN